MADERKFVIVIDGKETASTVAGKVERSLDKLGDQAKDTEKDFTGLDRKMREHADTITHLRQEIAKTGDVKLFGELGKQERAFGKLDGLKKSLSKAAGDAAPDMAVSLSGRLGPLLARLPVSGPLGAGLAVAAAAAAAPVGAVIAGAITGGVGVGGVIGGFAVAKNDPRVKAATSSLAAQIGSQLEAAAQPLVPAIVAAVDDAGDELSKLQSDLRSIFRNSAGNVEPLVKGAVGGLTAIVKGFDKLNAVAGPAVREIGDGLGDLGAEIGRTLDLLSDNGPEAADALHNLFTVINGSARVIGGTVNALTELYGKIRLGTAVMQGDTETIARYVTSQRDIWKALNGTGDAFHGVGVGAGAARAMLAAYNAEQRNTVDGAIDAREANLRYKESVIAAGEAVDGKKSVSIAEERALLALARATNDATVATDDSGVSAETAAARFAANRDKVIALAEKMGYSRAEARKLADQLLKIPSVKPTVTVNTKSANAALNAFVTKMNRIDGSVVTTYVATRSLPGGGYRASSSQGGGRVEEKAAGGPVTAGEIYKVGEQGPEYMVAPRDGYVINNRDSAMLAAGGAMSAPAASGGGGRAQQLVLQIQPGRASGLERMFLSWLKEAIGNAGGNTLALGY